MIFAQIAEGVDEVTWLYHLESREYKRWFEESIGDDELEMVARKTMSNAETSRPTVLAAIRQRYTGPG